MVKNLLCFIDVHKWEYKERDTGDIISKSSSFFVKIIESYEICSRCNLIKNRELWQRIFSINKKYNIVEGHYGDI